MAETWNILSVCSGIGGLDLGVRMAVRNARTVCYVEREAFCIANLAKATEEATLASAYLWTDLATFDGRPWRGVVDCLVVGFPCQPFSAAGQRKGIADSRWLWPHIIRVIRKVRPGYVFLENSPRIRKVALGIMLGDLARAGFDAEWDVFSAAEAGYPHLRKRFFLLAANPLGLRGIRTEAADAPDSFGAGCSTLCRGREDATSAGDGAVRDCHFADAADPPECAFWCAQSGVCVLDDGVPDRVDRLRGLGNAVVPLQAAVAFCLLYQRLCAGGAES